LKQLVITRWHSALMAPASDRLFVSFTMRLPSVSLRANAAPSALAAAASAAEYG
jgi:hypothetical protein